MAIDRTTLVQEPGLVQFGGAYFYSQGEIVAEMAPTLTDVTTDAFGVVDRRHTDRRIEIRFTPVGELESLSVLYPHGGLTVGDSLFGSSDSACKIWTPSGKSLEVHNCAVTQMPALTFAHDQPLFGEVVITGLVQNSTNPEAANSYYTYTASGETYPGDSQFDNSAIKMLGSEAAWGSDPWDAFYSEAGFSFSFDMSTEDVPADGHGTIDIRLTDIAATCSAVPLEITPANVEAKLEMQGSGNELGAARTGGDDLVVTNRVGSPALHVQLYGAQLDEQTALNFGRSVRGPGELSWRATREFSAGVAQPLFYVGTSAP